MFEDDEIDVPETKTPEIAAIFSAVDDELIEKEDDAIVDATDADAPADALLVDIPDAPEPAEDDEADKVPLAETYDLNAIYKKLVNNPTDEGLIKDLMNAVTRICPSVIRIVSKKFAGYLNTAPGAVREPGVYEANDISQEAAVRVYENWQKFNGGAKFSTWVFQIIKHLVLDAANAINKKAEVELLDNANDAPYGGVSNPGQRGHRAEETEHIAGAKCILPTGFTDQTEERLNDELDFEKAYRRLSGRDKRIVQMYRDGHSPADIGKALGRDAKWASNQLTRLKPLLQHGLHIVKSVFHTCRLPKTPVVDLKDGELYVKIDDEHRLLGRCRCRQQLTNLELKTLVENGDGQLVYKVAAGVLVSCDEVWAAQLRQVPRVGLNSNSADIDRATSRDYQSLRDIEEAHEMSVNALRALIVPARDDPWQGRVVFTSFREGRTEGCFTKHQFVQPPPRIVPPEFQKTLLESGARCPNCHKSKMSVYRYPDGSTYYLHGDCYNVIFGKIDLETSKSPVETVLLVEEAPCLDPACEADEHSPRALEQQVPSLFSSQATTAHAAAIVREEF